MKYTRKSMTWLHFVNLKNIFPLKTLGWMSTFNLSSACTHICTTLGREKKDSCTIYLYTFMIWFICILKTNIERQVLESWIVNESYEIISIYKVFILWYMIFYLIENDIKLTTEFVFVYNRFSKHEPTTFLSKILAY